MMVETAIIAEMAEKVAGGEKIEFSAFRKHKNIRKAIGYIIPDYKKLITMDKSKEEFQISGRTLHEPKFATADGKASNQDNIDYQLKEVMYAD